MSAPSALDQHGLQQALALHRLGQWAAAEGAYRALIAASPRDPNAPHLLGVLLAQRGVPGEALPFLRQAAKLAPKQAAIQANLANALKDLGRHAEAVTGYDRALALNPRDALSHSHRGQALAALGRGAEALASHDAAVALAPDLPEALNNRGCARREAGQEEEALADFEAALRLRADFLPALLNRGHALAALGRHAAALASYDAAIGFAPRNARAHANRAGLLAARGAREAALAGYEEALSLAPEDGTLHHNRASLLHALGRHEEARAAYARAFALGADPAEALFGQANALADLGRNGAALLLYDQALARRPDHAEARWNRALCRLRAGDHEGGWADYEARWARKEAPARRHVEIPAWDGLASLSGRHVLVHAEQGLGDTIQFCRYLPLLATLGAEVTLEVQAPLRRLLAEVPGARRVICPGDAVPRPDRQIALMSLPHVLGLGAPAPCPPYLAAEPARAAAWSASLPEGPRVGLVCSGSATHARDAERSLPLAALAPLLAEEAWFALVQNACRPTDAAFLAREPRLLDLRARLTDLAEAAGLIAALDLVITVDTAIAHLAGAMGRPVWLLLPFVADWRWGEQAAGTPWYPTMRLFRQQRAGEWPDVVAEAGAALREFLAARR